jgi:hypothetical protein
MALIKLLLANFADLCANFINNNHAPMLNGRSYVCMLVIYQTSVTLVAQ